MNYEKAVKAVKAIDWAKRKDITITEHDCGSALHWDKCYHVVDKKGYSYYVQRNVSDGEWQ